MDTPAAAIVVKGLTKSFGSHVAIRDVSFTVAKGEIVGFLGPNGAGKSTTMRILCGLLAASKGEAYIGGISVARSPDLIKRHLGYMPENNPLPEDLRVVEYLHWRAALKEIPRGKQSKRVNEVLELCDLHRKASRKLIGSLSKGFRQRVGLADAILAEPEVVILDEPTIGLDPHQVLIFRQLLDTLRGKTTIVLSSHILDEVERSCDRVMIINQGRIVACGTAQDLRSEYCTGTAIKIEFRGDKQALIKAIATVHADYVLHAAAPRSANDWLPAQILGNKAPMNDELLLRTLSALPGVELRAFAREEPSLETIFIAATKRSWDTELKGRNASPPASTDAPRPPSTPVATA
ncbi:MAG: ABC transporter ATP-binding protein [Verrucomicrobiota bacterium]|nr:ABC transporter ATP-binding protein [Verrucomicrobiota bacterium]